MAFTAEQLRATLQGLPQAPRYLVAFSGGLDSHCLLHALAALRGGLSVDLEAVHVHHGLQAQAEAWTEHCRAVAEGLNVPLTVLRVDAGAARGESPEAAARAARYAALRPLLGAGEVLLTAHHQDDQAETLLLQLLRGAGPAGLAAMPPLAPLGVGWLARPLLAVTRAALHAYARRHALRWVDDPMNQDPAFDRNYLRQQVLPRLRLRWPAASATLARAARHQAEALRLLEALGAIDLGAARGEREGTLRIEALRGLDGARQRNLLRLWLRERGLPVPGERRLSAALAGLLVEREDARPSARWPGAELRRYRGLLYGATPQPPFDASQVIAWDGRSVLEVAGACSAVDPTQLREGLGLEVAALEPPLTVRFRRGAERCRPQGRAHSQSLKKLLQEAGVPPWERERVPLLYAGERLVAVVGYWACA